MNFKNLSNSSKSKILTIFGLVVLGNGALFIEDGLENENAIVNETYYEVSQVSYPNNMYNETVEINSINLDNLSEEELLLYFESLDNVDFETVEGNEELFLNLLKSQANFILGTNSNIILNE